MKRPNPCYHCTNRTTTCRLDCQQWSEYVKKRDEEYKAAEKVRKQATDYIGYRCTLHERIEKRKKNSKR